MAMTDSWETLTPDKAVAYLERMDGNRTVRQTHVDFLAAQMRAGLWHDSPQGILFDTEGNMVDGQHRCWAVVESGVSVRIKVTRGVPREVVSVLDTGMPRSYADVAHYEGWSTDPLTASIARLLALGPTMRALRVPAELLHQWYEHYKEGIDFALHLRLSTRPSAGKSITVAMSAPFAAAFYHVGGEPLTRFGAVLQRGQIEVEADRAAFTLRDAWIGGRIGRSSSEQYFKTESAIRAFVERRPIRTLQRVEAIHFVPPKLPTALRLQDAPARRRTKQRTPEARQAA